MENLKLYRCEICGNLICMIEDSGMVPECCGLEMTRVKDCSRACEDDKKE